jgi:hypothetical protein
LIIVERLLAVDNLLAITALANQLPEHPEITALRMGQAWEYGTTLPSVVSPKCYFGFAQTGRSSIT